MLNGQFRYIAISFVLMQPQAKNSKVLGILLVLGKGKGTILMGCNVPENVF